jgi:hypothetical protein
MNVMKTQKEITISLGSVSEKKTYKMAAKYTFTMKGCPCTARSNTTFL